MMARRRQRFAAQMMDASAREPAAEPIAPVAEPVVAAEPIAPAARPASTAKPSRAAYMREYRAKRAKRI